MKRMTRVAGGGAVLGLSLLLVAGQALAQGEPRTGAGGRPSGSGVRSGAYLETSWSALCFEIGISADQIAKLRPTYQAAWKQRHTALKAAMAKRDFQAMAKTSEKIKATLDAKIKTVLTKNQMAQWTKWQNEARNRMRGAMGGGRAGSGGGRGGR